MTGIATVLELNDDVVITPVADLPEDTRIQAECASGDFAVSRTRGRAGSSIVDSDSAGLLERFREPRSVVEAVILFARQRGADANATLESAFPLLQTMLQRQVLIPAGPRSSAAKGSAPVWEIGSALPVGRIVRGLQVLDDGEVYLVAQPSGRHAVLKAVAASAGTAAVERLGNESAILSHLGGRVAPRLLDDGELDGRRYLLLELLQGTDAASAVEKIGTSGAARTRSGLLALVHRLCSAYAELHRCGVIHGDVHPRNVLVDRAGGTRLIDFGFARRNAGPLDAAGLERGGVPFYFEPELARALLEGTAPPPASEAGEQFAVGALIYQLVTGEHRQRFRLGKQEMLHDISHGAPRTFAECGAEAWPELEAVLQRALAPSPEARWSSMAAMTEAVASIDETARLHFPAPRQTGSRLRVVDELSADGHVFAAELAAPSASITYGAAGIALGLLHVAQRRASPALLSSADAWLARATRDIGDDRGFYNPDIEISREVVGECSPYHTPSGVHAVDALLGHATDDAARCARSISRFLDCAARPACGLDLTLGRASTLLGAAILLDVVPREGPIDEAPLRTFGDAVLTELWTHLDRFDVVGGRDTEHLGMAHGWGGFLYATMQWCATSGAAPPAGLERRLDELAAQAIPSGRGCEWPWILRQAGEPPTMSGWCGGSAGYVFLWTLAHRFLDSPRFLEVAEGAAWNVWEARDPAATLCCGLSGRGYALLNLFRHTREDAWLARARLLAEQAVRARSDREEFVHSLYKGALGPAVLHADLEDPDWGRMPFFEPAGYRDQG